MTLLDVWAMQLTSRWGISESGICAASHSTHLLSGWELLHCHKVTESRWVDSRCCTDRSLLIYIQHTKIHWMSWKLAASVLLSEGRSYHDIICRRLCKKPSVASTAVRELRGVVWCHLLLQEVSSAHLSHLRWSGQLNAGEKLHPATGGKTGTGNCLPNLS